MAKQKVKKMKDHDDEAEDKKLIKKMVKSECQTKSEKPAKKGKK